MHRLTSSFFAAPAAFVLSLSALGFAQDTPGFDMAPKFVQDAEALYEVEESTFTVLRAEVMEKGQANQQSKRTVRIHFKIIDVNDDGALVQGAYQSIAFSNQSDMMRSNLQFDSTKPVAEDGANPLAPVIRPLLGTPFTFKVSPGGNISEVKFAPGVVPSIPMARMARQFMDEATIQNRFAEIFTTRTPEPQQRVGSTWSSTQTIGSAAPGGMADALKITWTQTLVEADQTKTRIDVKGDATLAEGAASAVKPKLTKFDSKGVQDWAPYSGWLNTFEMTTVLHAEFNPQPDVTQTVESTDIKKIRRIK